MLQVHHGKVHLTRFDANEVYDKPRYILDFYDASYVTVSPHDGHVRASVHVDGYRTITDLVEVINKMEGEVVRQEEAEYAASIGEPVAVVV